MIRRPPRSTPLYSSAASDVYKRQGALCPQNVRNGLSKQMLNFLKQVKPNICFMWDVLALSMLAAEKCQLLFLRSSMSLAFPGVSWEKMSCVAVIACAALVMNLFLIARLW